MLYVLAQRTDPDGSQTPGAAELAYQVRGGPVFAVLADGGRARVPDAGTGAIRLPSRPAEHFVFADLSLMVDNPAIWQEVVDLRVPVIVDVHFPFGAPANVLSIQPGATDESRDPALDNAAIDLWSQPERIQTAWRVLRHASVVTSPRADWAALIADRIYHPIAVLPDVVDPRSGMRFYRAFMQVRAATAKAGPRTRVALRALSWFGARHIGAQMRASDVDWEARKAGKA